MKLTWNLIVGFVYYHTIQLKTIWERDLYRLGASGDLLFGLSRLTHYPFFPFGLRVYGRGDYFVALFFILKIFFFWHVVESNTVWSMKWSQIITKSLLIPPGQVNLEMNLLWVCDLDQPHLTHVEWFIWEIVCSYR